MLDPEKAKRKRLVNSIKELIEFTSTFHAVLLNLEIRVGMCGMPFKG